MPRTIAVSIKQPPEESSLYFAVSEGAPQLYTDEGKALPTHKAAGHNAFILDMHAARARNAPELAAIVRHYVPAEAEIAPVALAEVTPDPIRFALTDWRKTEHPDAASWPDDPIADEPREIVLTHDEDRIVLTMATGEGEAISVWLELQGKRLIVRGYDPDHESPVAMRIGETAILIDTHDRDAEEGPGANHPRPTMGNKRS